MYNVDLMQSRRQPVNQKKLAGEDFGDALTRSPYESRHDHSVQPEWNCAMFREFCRI
jgi:hypothetical protein